MMLVNWNYFKKPLNNELKTTAPPKQRPTSSLGVNYCERCSMWFKMKDGKTTCGANRPKDLEEYGFEVPERLRETLVTSVAPDAALAMAHPPEEEFVDPTDWETEFFRELKPEKIFSSLDTPVPWRPSETRIPFSQP